MSMLTEQAKRLRDHASTMQAYAHDTSLVDHDKYANDSDEWACFWEPMMTAAACYMNEAADTIEELREKAKASSEVDA